MGTHSKASGLAREGRKRACRAGRRVRAGIAEAVAKTMLRLPRLAGRMTFLLVTAGLFLVHASSPLPRALAGDKAELAGKPAPLERAFHGTLPPNVVEMRELILAAVHSGDIDELADAIQWNEIKPDFGAAGGDPIAHWKRLAADGEGREVLAVLANLLALPPARLALGRDPENTHVYVWPYLAELPLDGLKPGEEVDLLRLMPADAVRAMKAAKKWTWWRLAIGADGTWHTFRTYE